ncbi:hypothetical protein [Grimontia sp. NTOU-MAR1]|uniref:hypothetical protein n=1 Tax=Grimontia sp. NTOU-MAR1 TaxID=3111011 RepID=UPI002DBA0CFA|nr:hypothetical protein [Grimontia sp. NTOU-MAR1]WRV99775.1 hypothetical protein VP504_22570 [Grimontia sp. NTOU-MAR1]
MANPDFQPADELSEEIRPICKQTAKPLSQLDMMLILTMLLLVLDGGMSASFSTSRVALPNSNLNYKHPTL